ncbi:hypothetical protein [Phenylobacterium sp.]|uniref:hypothetical protein n=1 Tax=Phenylobacterium sp. TaxID=1871053 RepID=UPI0025F76B22|nr:hypothetical protein [Phenylobacterium sp.]
METPPEAPEPGPRRRLPLIAVGGVVALFAGLGIAWALVSGDRGSKTAPAASEAGLVIDSSGAGDARIDPGKPLRCFVQGRFAGELSLRECARRNGVATDALDVGLDQTGALAAADQAGQTLTPLPPVQEQPPAPEALAAAPETTEPAPALAAGGGACWRHGGGRWRRLADMDLNACVQALFAGRCEKPGGATYGRFGQQTLRLVTGKVEVSDDNKSFRTLILQPADCSLPPTG